MGLVHDKAFFLFLIILMGLTDASRVMTHAINVDCAFEGERPIIDQVAA